MTMNLTDFVRFSNQLFRACICAAPTMAGGSWPVNRSVRVSITKTSLQPELNVYQSLSGVPTSGSKAGPWMSWYE